MHAIQSLKKSPKPYTRHELNGNMLILEQAVCVYVHAIDHFIWLGGLFIRLFANMHAQSDS